VDSVRPNFKKPTEIFLWYFALIVICNRLTIFMVKCITLCLAFIVANVRVVVLSLLIRLFYFYKFVTIDARMVDANLFIKVCYPDEVQPLNVSRFTK
jgi:hypothetical protein